jgi:hypothetical protein
MLCGLLLIIVGYHYYDVCVQLILCIYVCIIVCVVKFNVQSITITSSGDSKKKAQQMIRTHIQSDTNSLKSSITAALHRLVTLCTIGGRCQCLYQQI